MVEARARALIGAPFRLHGREAATGLDCVGVVAVATGVEAPTGYALRSGDVDGIRGALEAAGLSAVAKALPGDVLLMRVGPTQLHLAVRSRRGLIHADAGLRRVVERPGAGLGGAGNMATLVLSAVGGLLGPVGGAVGALIGQAIDGRIFKPKGRQGPRLQDLKIQTSSYGAPIPKLFGTMRVAGTVIWATDLIESRNRQGGGKGRPSSTTYSYSASFAVLLSGRPIRSVGRIWADGNLLRGAAGDWKSETGFRLHTGELDQPVDPFIASAESGDGTPAYRGCAYAVFEIMALAPFGNRIPSLTFEVEADAEPVPIGSILAAVSGSIESAGQGVALRGFAASGDTVQALIETLREAISLEFRDDDARLRLVGPLDPIVVIAAAEIQESRQETLAGLTELPAGLALSYYEASRDYQIGVQEAQSGAGRRSDRVEFAAVLEAGEARALAEQALARRTRERGQRTVRCGWARLAVAPGALLRLPDDDGIWRVVARSVDRGGVRLDLRRIRFGSLSPPPADPGRSVPAADFVHGPTVIHVLDLPVVEDLLPDVPRLYVAAAGRSRGWRRANVSISLDQGASWTSHGTTAVAAVIGSAETILADGDPALFDRDHTVDVALLHADMLLEDADPARLLAGANMALLGDELIQFGRARPLGLARWRLSELTRGRLGSGWATGTHVAGDRFVLIEPESLLRVQPPLNLVGSEIRVLAWGVGDLAPVEESAIGIGEALRPPPPVHLAARRRGDGGFDLSWVRSSRSGWAWLDGADAPLAEQTEGYRTIITRGDGLQRVHDVAAPAFLYDADAVVEDLAEGREVTLSVAQTGTRASSRPATLTFTL